MYGLRRVVKVVIWETTLQGPLHVQMMHVKLICATIQNMKIPVGRCEDFANEYNVLLMLKMYIFSICRLCTYRSNINIGVYGEMLMIMLSI